MASELKSVCTCGHIGDGPDSQHADSTIAAGHGGCTVDGCDCEQFTWAKFLNDPT